MIAQIVEITTLGKLILEFRERFKPPGELDETSNFMELSIRPGPYEIPAEKFEFVWELEDFDEATGIMLI